MTTADPIAKFGSMADLYFQHQHYNLTAEEFDEMPSEPRGMTSGAKWRYIFNASGGPEVREVCGEVITFDDGSQYRKAEGWTCGEVIR